MINLESKIPTPQAFGENVTCLQERKCQNKQYLGVFFITEINLKMLMKIETGRYHEYMNFKWR